MSLFIDRPILSSVISIFIFLAGLVAIFLLPIEQFPNLLPPQINVSATYPGANADTVANTVASPLEQQINGVENMIYMYSNSSSTGQYTLNVFFDIGSSIEQALIDVQNQANIANPLLPEQVQKSGVSILKQTPAILLLVAMQSPDNRYDDIFLSNYATVNVVEELQRTPGVSNVKIINDRSYAMRIWLDPDLLTKYGLTTGDVNSAIRDENSDTSLGRLGQTPTNGPIELTFSMKSVGRFTTPDEFDNIILKANQDGSIVYLKDVGYTELGAQNYDVQSDINGVSTISIAIYQQFGANALEVASNVKNKMKQISEKFPQGIEYSIPYDTTKFVIASIREVVKTLIEAAVLVALVVLIFLQSIRLMIIPVIAMVVAIVGTFLGMLALGITINLLTLFALVLAIGIVVDDAIVVIENVEHNIRLHGFSAKEAAHQAMKEVTAPIVATSMVLCAVFIPVAFLGGIAGQLYKQFALTISISVFISSIVALTLSPALSALLVKPRGTPSTFTIWFDRFFDKVSTLYIKGARWLIVRPWLGGSIFFAICCLIALLFHVVPKGFVPNEDQGYLIGVVNMPEGTSLNRTVATSVKTEKIALENPAVKTYLELTGLSFLDNLNRTNMGTNFIILKDWDQREMKSEQAFAVIRELSEKFSKIPEGQALIFNPPAIQGLGTVGGFEFWLQNRGSGDYAHLEDVAHKLIDKASERPELTNLVPTISANTQQLYIDLDRSKARSLGVPIGEIYNALQSLFGSLYVNNFNKYGRVYQVIVMAQPRLRVTPTDITNIYVKSILGNMVPLNALVILKNTSGPNMMSRFNSFPSRSQGAQPPAIAPGRRWMPWRRSLRRCCPRI